MEEIGQTLDCSEFIDALKRLYNTLSITEKNQLLATSHKWDVERENYVVHPPFEPKINARSQRMAQDRLKQGESIEDYLVRRRSEMDKKLQKIRNSKKNDDLKG